MGAKKKKAAGDAAKGEKVFKNLCAVCHSLSVRKLHWSAHIFTRPTPLALLLEESRV